MKKASRLDYAYAVGRVRVLERYLVSSAVFREAADEKDASAAIKTIFDAGSFLDEMTDVRNPEELDLFLANEERQLLKTLSEIFIEKELSSIMIHEISAPLTSFSIAQKLEYAFISDYFRHRIDLGNLKLFFRAKYSLRPKEWLENVLLTGGFFSPDLLLSNFDLSYAEIAEKLHSTPYQKLWEAAADAIEEKETFVALERGIEDYLIRYLKKAKFFVFGPEPIFAYGLAKRRELGLVRILGVGKMNHIPSEILKERLGDTYA
ncbi:MAG: V-type ATPase subunit [Candidatus Aminicenantes bacterium]|jgi:V/A-type H+-transporting ATPase subunit C